MRVGIVAVYLVSLWVAHTLLSAHYIHTCQRSFIAALAGHGSVYCAAIEKSLRALEAGPVILCVAAQQQIAGGLFRRALRDNNNNNIDG